jgi:hypothetical protein
MIHRQHFVTQRAERSMDANAWRVAGNEMQIRALFRQRIGEIFIDLIQ